MSSFQRFEQRDMPVLAVIITFVLLGWFLGEATAQSPKLTWVAEKCVEHADVGTPADATCLGKLRALSPERAIEAKIIPDVYSPGHVSGSYPTRTTFYLYYRKAL